MPKTNIPLGENGLDYADESLQLFKRVFNQDRTYTGTDSFISKSSGISYSTDDYPNNATIYNKGNVGMINLLNMLYGGEDGFLFQSSDYNKYLSSKPPFISNISSLGTFIGGAPFRANFLAMPNNNTINLPSSSGAPTDFTIDYVMDGNRTTIYPKTIIKNVLSTLYGDVEQRINNYQRDASTKRIATIIIGTSSAGHTTNDVDYLCNGTNDTTQFMSALTALDNQSGGNIVFREGTYNINSNAAINTTKNIVVQGLGSATIFNFTSSAYLNLTGGNITIKNISFTTTSGQQAILVNGNNIEVLNCTFNGFTTATINITNSVNNATVKNCYIDGSNSVSTPCTIGGDSLKFIDNIIITGANNGIIIRNATNSSISYNFISTSVISQGHGIIFSNDTTAEITYNTTINSNILTNFKVGIRYGGSSTNYIGKNLTIESNIIMGDSTSTGIQVDDFQNINISKNIINKSNYGIYVASVQFCNVNSNIIISATHSGFLINRPFDTSPQGNEYITVSNNIFDRCQLGLNMWYFDNCIITNNTITNNIANAIQSLEPSSNSLFSYNNLGGSGGYYGGTNHTQVNNF